MGDWAEAQQREPGALWHAARTRLRRHGQLWPAPLVEDREAPRPRMQSEGAAGDARHHKGAESPPWRDFHENKAGFLQLGS